jgi:hypothetical protein
MGLALVRAALHDQSGMKMWKTPRARRAAGQSYAWLVRVAVKKMASAVCCFCLT